jgi:hypothetical protein
MIVEAFVLMINYYEVNFMIFIYSFFLIFKILKLFDSIKYKPYIITNIKIFIFKIMKIFRQKFLKLIF